MAHHRSYFSTAVLLASAIAMGPFTIDTYLPAFPQIAGHLDIEIHQVSLSISIYVFFVAFGSILGGPLSDRYGRKCVMMTGFLVFLVASVMLSRSQSLAELLGWRAVQAFGGGWIGVSVPAIIRDRVNGKEAARMFSLVGLIMYIAPAIAPTVGSTLLELGSWRTIFGFLAVYAGIVGLLIWNQLLANYPVNPHIQKQNLISSYRSVLEQPLALRFIVINGLMFSVMIVFITHASFIYQEWFGLSSYHFSLLFAANIIAMTLMNLLGRRLLHYFEPVQIVKMATAFQCAMMLSLLIVVLFMPKLALFVPFLMLTVGSLGASAPNIQASYLYFFGKNSGAASALMGSIPFIITGIISALSSVASDGTLLPIALIMFACSVCAAGLAWNAPMLMKREIAKEANTDVKLA